MKPVYYPELRRAVPTTGAGTVRLYGPLTRPVTLAALERWQALADPPQTVGEVIDRIVAHAAATGFHINDGRRVLPAAEMDTLQ